MSRDARTRTEAALLRYFGGDGACYAKGRPLRDLSHLPYDRHKVHPDSLPPSGAPGSGIPKDAAFRWAKLDRVYRSLSELHQGALARAYTSFLLPAPLHLPPSLRWFWAMPEDMGMEIYDYGVAKQTAIALLVEAEQAFERVLFGSVTPEPPPGPLWLSLKDLADTEGIGVPALRKRIRVGTWRDILPQCGRVEWEDLADNAMDLLATWCSAEPNRPRYF